MPDYKRNIRRIVEVQKKMSSCILVKVGEVHLKGLNRPYFEKKLAEHIRAAVRPFGGKVNSAQSRIYVHNISDEDMEAATERLRRVFGIHALSVATEAEKDIDALCTAVIEVMAQQGITKGSFKIKARRSDKRFPMESPEICAHIGGAVLEAYPEMKVDVHDPQHTIEVEIREKAYIYASSIPAVGGMPVGTNGKAMLLLSGGIDSPVAGYMIAKRGVVLEAVHFHSFPHTSERAKQKVIDLARELSAYCGPIRLHIVSFTKLQEAIYNNCPDKTITVVMRRYMMRIAQQIAKQNGASALITGESIGQVASQTMESLCCTDAVTDIPVFRPLIGMDKLEIMNRAEEIGTYKTSILPYEDCCTVFTPRHPVTHPTLELMEEAEKCFDGQEMLKEAIETAELMEIRPAQA